MQYIVKPGDTLQNIADYYQIDLNTLKEYNNLMDNDLEEGMVINIPYESPLEYYKVKAGDDLYSIATKLAIPVEFLAKLNGLKSGDYIYPNQELLVPKKGYKIYLTNKGDSINSIAKKLNTQINEIINTNRDLYLIEDQLVIYRG